MQSIHYINKIAVAETKWKRDITKDNQNNLRFTVLKPLTNIAQENRKKHKTM